MTGFLKNILIKTIGIGFICLILGFLTYSINGDFYASYEQAEIIERAETFHSLSGQTNTVFIGSSRIFRHVDPALFDQHTGAKSYNLGFAGMFPYRSYQYLEYLNLKENEDVKNIFIELSPIARLGENFNTDPFIYSINLDQYYEVIDFTLNSQYNSLLKAKYLGGYSLLFFYKYFGIGSAKYLNQYMWGPSLQTSETEKTNYHNGYISLDEDYARKGDNYADLKNRNEGFLNNYEKELEAYIQAYHEVKNIEVDMSQDEFTSYVIDQAEALIKKGKNVYFIISPRQEYDDLYYLLSQKKKLEKEYAIIDFSNPADFPPLYTKEYSFDRVHLNKRGAELFTEELAEAVKSNF